MATVTVGSGRGQSGHTELTEGEASRGPGRWRCEGVQVAVRPRPGVPVLRGVRTAPHRRAQRGWGARSPLSAPQCVRPRKYMLDCVMLVNGEPKATHLGGGGGRIDPRWSDATDHR